MGLKMEQIIVLMAAMPLQVLSQASDRHTVRHGPLTLCSPALLVASKIVVYGNLLAGNRPIKEFRKMHDKKLSGLGNVVRAVPPMSVEHIVEYDKRFLLNVETDNSKTTGILWYTNFSQ